MSLITSPGIRKVAGACDVAQGQAAHVNAGYDACRPSLSYDTSRWCAMRGAEIISSVSGCGGGGGRPTEMAFSAMIA